MPYTATFERWEKKYRLTGAQADALLPLLARHMKADCYGETTVCSLYLDTPDNLLIRRSLEKPYYKEKMRLRSYGVPQNEDPVFWEIKKKAGGIVYKRRAALTAREAMDCLLDGKKPAPRGQILREIGVMLDHYGLRPAMMLCCERTAYAESSPTPDALRITLDRGIRWRDSSLDLRLGDGGAPLLGPGERLMELKTARSLPLWLCGALSEIRAYPTSFSKYGQAYAARLAAGSLARQAG